MNIPCVSVMWRMVNGRDTLLFSDRKNPLGWRWEYNWCPSGGTQRAVKISGKTRRFGKSSWIDHENVGEKPSWENQVIRYQRTCLADQLWHWTTAKRGWQLSTSGYCYRRRSRTSGHKDTQTRHVDSYQNYVETAQFPGKWNSIV